MKIVALRNTGIDHVETISFPSLVFANWCFEIKKFDHISWLLVQFKLIYVIDFVNLNHIGQ